MDVREKTAGLDNEAEYNRLREELAKANKENQYLRVELKVKESELRYYIGFETAVKIIFGGCN